MDPTKLISLGIDLVIGLVVLGLALWLGSKAVDTAQAPAKLEAAIGVNHAQKEGIDASNKGVDAVKTESDVKIAESKAAMKDAGKPNFAAAARIQEAKPAGDTPLARAANLINAEFQK